MHCTKKITDDLVWVGANDRRLAMFEGVYSVPDGVSYNSYLLTDEKTVLFDTVDKAVRQRFLENVEHALGGRPLDYIVVQHVEPDHSATLEELSRKHPGAKIVCNEKSLNLIEQFFDFDARSKAHVVGEGDTLNTGRHELQFVMAPMVHWPEVMVTYDATDKVLFSADAFGCFGALNGALFADEVDFAKDYMDEARRYYANIVGKYGTQVKSLLDKASNLEIDMICPLHGFVWRQKLDEITSKYALWGGYEPEDYGVLIAYASVYGNTENAAEILSSKLRDSGVPTAMYDVSVAPASEIVAEAFRLSHMVLASTTYNAGIFVSMEALIHDLTAHNIQNRTVAVIENGSWAATSGGLIREKLAKCKNISILDKNVSLKSGLKADKLADIDAMADALASSVKAAAAAAAEAASIAGDTIAAAPKGAGIGGSVVSASALVATGGTSSVIDPVTMFKLSYGLFVLTAKLGEKDNGCIINTASQITQTPLRLSIVVNKSNLTHDIIKKTNLFNISVLTESAPFRLFERFGFQSGGKVDKFAGVSYDDRSANGLRYIPEHVSGVISGRVLSDTDCGTHTLFFADVTEAFTLSNERSVTYQYYFDHIKPAPPRPKEGKTGFVCKICGYVHEGDKLPKDFVCPLCKHGAEDFEKL